MDFIKGLQEARMLRDANNAKKLTYSDCAESVYLILMAMDIMRNYKQTSSEIREYARKSHSGSYNTFKIGSTDLYNFLHIVTGDDEVMKKLKDPASASEMRENSVPPIDRIKEYLKSLKDSKKPSMTTRMFMDIESGLNISNNTYKEIRRNITNWPELTKNNQKVTATKLAFAIRAKLRSSDFIEYYEKWMAIFDLESTRTPDNEPIINTPDISVDMSDIAVYRYLVGAENLALLKQMLELAKNNKGIPQRHMQAYMPIVEIVDDIVKGGPAFIQQLKVLQTRANRSRNE